MDSNTKLIWTNRALNLVAIFGFILTTAPPETPLFCSILNGRET